MKSYIKNTLALALLSGVVLVISGEPVLAQTADQVQQGVNAIGGGDSPSADNALEIIVNAFLFLIGAVSIVMIVYGGFRYVTSAGDSSAVSAAKNTILYAVIGLVVALTAYAISDFVVGLFEEDSATTTDTTTNTPPVQQSRPGFGPTP